jgi:glycosyltransferase involved in cell wall biosynthesis
MEWSRIWQRGKRALLFRTLGTDLIAPGWFIKTKWRLIFSRKIKVGFGPITTGENDLAERKWRIDPIINGLNHKSHKYVAGFFLRPEEMNRFDYLVIVKKLNLEFIEAFEHLKNQKVIYDIVDNPNDEPKYGLYFRSLPQFLKRVDAFILSSPVHKPWVEHLRKPALLIEHPILNTVHKQTYQNGPEIRLLAQGYFENLKNLEWLEPLLPELSVRVGRPIRLVYHSEIIRPDSEFVRYIRWNVENCFEVMEQSDIAITIKNLHKPHQYTKPSTKVIAYMAAGLPVICYPTAADRLVIQDRVTGFFAYKREDWIRLIQLLASSVPIRRRVGRAARKSVLERYSVGPILEKYVTILDSV